MKKMSTISVSSQGMSLLEMVVAMLMLVMFTGVVVAVLGVTARFAGEIESGEKGSNGVLINHQEIQIGFDQLAQVLSQPGITKERLMGMNPKSGQKRIAFSSTADPDNACAPAGSDPLAYWGLPGPSLIFPSNYRICVWQTGLVEASIKDLATDGWPQNNAKAGIYVLQALPERSDAANLPTRRLFCRPRPYC